MCFNTETNHVRWLYEVPKDKFMAYENLGCMTEPGKFASLV